MSKDDREGCVFSTADLAELRKFEDSIPSREPIDLQDAIRAYRDRPSMEAELQELRDKRQRYEAALKQIKGFSHHCECCRDTGQIAANALKGEGEV